MHHHLTSLLLQALRGLGLTGSATFSTKKVQVHPLISTLTPERRGRILKTTELQVSWDQIFDDALLWYPAGQAIGSKDEEKR